MSGVNTHGVFDRAAHRFHNGDTLLLWCILCSAEEGAKEARFVLLDIDIQVLVVVECGGWKLATFDIGRWFALIKTVCDECHSLRDSE